MSGFLYRGRGFVTESEDMDHMTDIRSDETEKGPPVQTHALREFEQHLNDLKKENFSLKLRIYFLEERIQQKHEHARDDVYKKNIELKVEVESLKQELQEKQQFLAKALTTGDSLTNHHEGDLQQQSNERQQEIEHMQEVLETKIQLLQAEAKLARDEAGRMACLAESQSQRCATLEKRIKETTEIDGPLHQKALDEKDRVINELEETLISKEALITALTGEKAQLHESVRELKEQVQDLSASLQQKDRNSKLLQDKLAREKLRIQQQTQMKDLCRICARELCGNQRRWIFHPASKLNLQVLLSHALGRELTRDGKGEFACSKCTFMLDRMYRFDTVIARVEALSIERLHRLLLEKDRLRQCIGGLYRKNNCDEPAPRPVADSKGSECTVDISGLHDAKYNALLQDDLTYSVYESWAEHEEQVVESHHHHHCPMSEVSGPHRSRKCRGCAALRVADSDYEAVCRVPRKLARSISCGPSTRYSASVCSEDPSGAATLVPESLPTTSESDRTLIDTDAERGSGSSSMESLDTAVDVSRPSAREGDTDRDAKEDLKSESLSEEPVCLRDSKLDLALNLAKSCEYKPVQSPRGSKLPILLKPVSPESMVFSEPGLQTPYSMGCESSPCLPELSLPQTQTDLLLELSELDKLWQDTYMEYKPIGFRQNLIEEQQSQLNQYECATGRCVNELQKAQLQVQSLQAKIQESETENWKLQEKLYEMESELRAVKQAAQKQERTIQSLNDTVSSKSSEAEELLRVIEGQKDMLCKLKETVSRYHLQTLQGPTAQPPPLQAELLALQSSLFSTQLELQDCQRAQRQSLRQVTDVTCARDRLQSDLQEALKHWEATEKHNQEMRGALKQARADLLERKGQVTEKDRQRQMEVEARDKTITQLRQTLRDKQQLLQDYSELLEHQQDPSQTRDAMLDKLKSRIKDRDRALERAIDEKFRCLEEKEGEVRRLQLALREKEMDQEKLRCVLSNNEETILHLDRLAQGKQLQVEQMSAVSRNAQQLRQQAEERLGCSVRERDSIITQLQASLHTHSQEAQGLRDVVLSKSPAGSAALLEQLKLQLQLKENLFQQLLSDRSSQAQQHQAELQELLHTISNRDQCMQDCAARLGQVISQQTQELQELRRQLCCKEREVRELSREKEQQGWDPQLEIKRLQSQLQEKEAFIQELMQDSPPCQEEPMITSRPKEEPVKGRSHKSRGPQRDMQAVQEELQLVLKKEKAAQLELCSLRSALAQHKEEMQTQAAELEALTRTVNIKEQLVKDLQTQLVEPSGLPLVDRLTQELQELRETVAKQDTTGTDPQSTLEQLVSDYSKLNDALKTEKQLYLNLTQMHSSRDSEKSRTLQVELGRVEALRAQLEDALRRVRDSASAPQRAAKPPADSGEFSADEEDDDDASSEGTDIVEEEDSAQLTAESLASSQDVGLTCTNRGLEGRMLSQHTAKDGQALAKVQKLLEQKQIVEHELGELKFQLEKAGYTSLSQMRTALLSLRVQTDEASGQNEQPTRRKQEAGDVGGRSGGRQQRSFPEEEQEEEEEDDEEQGSVTAEWMEVGGELSPVQGKRSAPYLQLREGHGKRRCARPLSLDLGALLQQQAENTYTQEAEPGEDVGGFWQDVEEGLRERALRLRSDLALSRQESRHLQERLMVSEATVQAQAEQLKDFRDLLSETSVQQDSKHVQVDLQDLGYETCGRSENEAEREGASSPEFDDLEMCTALSRDDGGQEWWSGNCGKSEDVMSLQRRVEELRSQLSRSQATIRSLQSQMRSLSTTSDYASSLERPRKVNWGFQASSAHSGLEEDEGWQSDGLGTPRSRHSQELQELVTRVASLEDQLKNSRPEGKKAVEDAKSATWPGKFDSLIQAQARELSHLRQRLRDGRGVCHILTQHLGDTTKSFEELLRANDIDYYMGQSFREQLAQSSALAERISAKISGREQSELPDDKMGHELLAIRLSKELQQKDKIIESLRSKLKQERSDTPSSSHALSETSDQSDRTSFVSDDQGSTHKDLDLCSDFDAASEYTEEGRPSPRQQTQTDSHCHALVPPQSTHLSHHPHLPCMGLSPTLAVPACHAHSTHLWTVQDRKASVLDPCPALSFPPRLTTAPTSQVKGHLLSLTPTLPSCVPVSMALGPSPWQRFTRSCRCFKDSWERVNGLLFPTPMSRPCLVSHWPATPIRPISAVALPCTIMPFLSMGLPLLVQTPH
ncbi:hypothetical protein GJAV_G00082230 [Gymnothorax javanicus]|nr:hypothetical protein GJAV_G00082230 [Gymnothorax javanicus]